MPPREDQVPETQGTSTTAPQGPRGGSDIERKPTAKAGRVWIQDSSQAASQRRIPRPRESGGGRKKQVTPRAVPTPRAESLGCGTCQHRDGNLGWGSDAWSWHLHSKGVRPPAHPQREERPPRREGSLAPGRASPCPRRGPRSPHTTRRGSLARRRPCPSSEAPIPTRRGAGTSHPHTPRGPDTDAARGRGRGTTPGRRRGAWRRERRRGPRTAGQAASAGAARGGNGGGHVATGGGVAGAGGGGGGGRRRRGRRGRGPAQSSLTLSPQELAPPLRSLSRQAGEASARRLFLAPRARALSR